MRVDNMFAPENATLTFTRQETSDSWHSHCNYGGDFNQGGGREGETEEGQREMERSVWIDDDKKNGERTIVYLEIDVTF